MMFYLLFQKKYALVLFKYYTKKSTNAYKPKDKQLSLSIWFFLRI